MSYRVSALERLKRKKRNLLMNRLGGQLKKSGEKITGGKGFGVPNENEKSGEWVKKGRFK